MDQRYPFGKKFKFGDPVDRLLVDFPASEIWRLLSDGWQHQFGSHMFFTKFYWGLSQGLQCIAKHIGDERVTPIFLVELYRSAFQHEEDFKQKDYDGFRVEKWECYFPVFMESKSCKQDASMSPAGFYEFVDHVVEADTPVIYQKADGSLETSYKWRLKFDEDENYFNPHAEKFLKEDKSVDKDKVAWYLRQKFNALKAKHDRGEVNYSITIRGGCVPVTEVVTLVQCYLDEFYRSMAEIKDESREQREDKILGLIIGLVGKLHRGHFFTDGNGRTFVFLLKNYLLMKYLDAFCITLTPAHFTAHSVDELKKEIQEGRRLFNEFLVTRAAAFLKTIKPRDFEDGYLDMKTRLKATLSDKPMIALAQVSELFSRVKAGVDQKELKLFTTGDLRTDILVMLKDVYYEIVCKMVEDQNDHIKKNKQGAQAYSDQYGNVATPQAFLSIVNQHEIYHDKLYPCGVFRSKETDLEKIVNTEMKKCRFYPLKEHRWESIVISNHFLKPKKAGPKTV